MTPGIPLADPLPQPAPRLLLWLLLQGTFLLHLLAINLVLGGTILALHWRVSKSQAEAPQRTTFLRLFDRALPIGIAVAISLGVAPLLFVQVLYGRVFYTSSILMAWFWLALVPLLLIAYGGAYRLAFRADRPGRAGLGLAGVVTLLLASVAFLQVTNATRGLRPETFLPVFRADPRGLTLNLDDPSFWPRYLHVLLGAVAVSALALALVGVLRRAQDAAFARWAVRRGTTLFAVASAANVFVGMSFLIALPKPLLVRLVGGDTHAMGLLASGILLGVGLGGAALLALGAKDTVRATWTLAGLTLATLAVMLLLREELRRITLRSAGFEPPSWIVPQWGPFAAFAICLVAGIAASAWMIHSLAHARGPRR